MFASGLSTLAYAGTNSKNCLNNNDENTMNQEYWYQIAFSRNHFTVVISSLEWFEGGSEWVVKQADPIARWMMGITIQDIKIWVQQNDGSIEALRDSQARIVI